MPPTDTDIPHRKNAAEWLMWVALQPLRLVLILRRSKGKANHGA